MCTSNSSTALEHDCISVSIEIRRDEHVICLEEMQSRDKPVHKLFNVAELNQQIINYYNINEMNRCFISPKPHLLEKFTFSVFVLLFISTNPFVFGIYLCVDIYYILHERLCYYKGL